MAIKNKDGSTYTLRGPNPLMSEQADWDKTKIKLINLSWKSEIIEDQRNPIKEIKKNVVNLPEELGFKSKPVSKIVPTKDFISEITAPVQPPKEIPQVATPQVEPETTVIIDVDPKLARVLKERGAEYFCSPVIGTKTHTDEFYLNSYEVPIYGDEFVFDAIMIDQSDLQLQIWSVKYIPKGSIIYKKVKDGGERWWRVSQIEPKTGGFISLSVISDMNPEFS